MSRQLRSSLALILPLIVLWAWAGCVLMCVDETAGCEKSAAYGSQASSAEPLCTETCSPAYPAAFRERVDVSAPVLSSAGAAAIRYTAAAPPQVRAVSHVRGHSPPRSAPPLFVQFRNFRI